MFFISCPAGGDEQALRRISGNPVDHAVLRHSLDAADQDVCVFFEAEQVEGLRSFVRDYDWASITVNALCTYLRVTPEERLAYFGY